MRMNAFAATAAVLAFAAMMAAVPAARADTICNGTLTGRINGNVVVPNGDTCTLSDVTVTGNVTVGTGATLSVDQDTAIGGNIQATLCNSVTITGSTGEAPAPILVRGNVTIQQCTAPSGIENLGEGFFTSQILINGNFQCSNNSAGCDVVEGSIGGNVQIDNNSGTDFFGDNSVVVFSSVGGNVEFNNNSGPSANFVGLDTIGGNLQCQGNTPPVSNGGFPNQVVGNEQGQCSGL